MIDHEDSQTCFCGYVLATWKGTQTAIYEVVDRNGAEKTKRPTSH